jgi:hypothetical protein
VIQAVILVFAPNVMLGFSLFSLLAHSLPQLAIKPAPSFPTLDQLKTELHYPKSYMLQ